MPIHIGRPTEHGFDEPLGLLSDCHRRIERFLGAMLTIVKRSGGGENAEAIPSAVSAHSAARGSSSAQRVTRKALHR
jgi:hypothetical protein